MKTRKNNLKIKTSKTTRKQKQHIHTIPIVVICYNQLSYIKNIVEQLEKHNNPIILIDNHSTYKPLFDYYKEIKGKLKDKIEIRLLNKNYGCTVYEKLKNTLPEIYVLSDPDIELNKNMPDDFAEIMMSISEKYKVYRVHGFIEKVPKKDIIPCPGYNFNWGKKEHKIRDSQYELFYDYTIGGATTFSLINTKYRNNPGKISSINIAGDFSIKHLPWYKDTINKIPRNELYEYVKGAKWSTVIGQCIRPKLKSLHDIYKFEFK